MLQQKEKVLTKQGSQDGTKKTPKITIDNLQETAIKAAYHTVSLLYRGQVKSIKDRNGVTINHDGNSGGDNKIRDIKNGFHNAMSSAYINHHKAIQDASTPTKETGARISGTIDKYINTTATDTDDCIQEAVTALYEDMHDNGGNECGPDGFKKACQAVRRYIYQQDSNTSTRIRRIYNDMGELLKVNDYKYIKYPHLYIDSVTATDESGHATQWEVEDVHNGITQLINGMIAHETITEILSVMTATQKRIIHYMAQGFTNTTIAKRLNISPSAVTQHIQAIRRKASQFKPD